MIELPSCSAIAARALSDLAQRLPVGFELAGHPVVASLCLGAPPAPPADWRRVGLVVATQQAAVSLAPTLLPPAATAHWPEIETVGVPGALRDILRGLLLDDIAATLAPLAGDHPRWQPAPDKPLPHAIALVNARTLAPVGLLELDERALAWLAARCTDLPRHTVDIDGVTMPLDLIIDRVVISRTELAALGPRDVVLLDRTPVDADGGVTAVLCMPGFPGFRVRIDGGRATLDSPVDAAMDTPTSPPAASIDEVPLVIDCDVGRIGLTIGRLRELSAGQVLDLGLDATQRVSLRLNGQVIAMGELVRIAERTGVRITDVLLSRTT